MRILIMVILCCKWWGDEAFERVGLVGVDLWLHIRKIQTFSTRWPVWRTIVWNGEGRIKWNSRWGMERAGHVGTPKSVGIVGAFWIQKSSSGWSWSSSRWVVANPTCLNELADKGGEAPWGLLSSSPSFWQRRRTFIWTRWSRRLCVRRFFV